MLYDKTAVNMFLYLFIFNGIFLGLFFFFIKTPFQDKKTFALLSKYKKRGVLSSVALLLIGAAINYKTINLIIEKVMSAREGTIIIISILMVAVILYSFFTAIVWVYDQISPLDDFTIQDRKSLIFQNSEGYIICLDKKEEEKKSIKYIILCLCSMLIGIFLFFYAIWHNAIEADFGYGSTSHPFLTSIINPKYSIKKISYIYNNMSFYAEKHELILELITGYIIALIFTALCIAISTFYIKDDFSKRAKFWKIIWLSILGFTVIQFMLNIKGTTFIAFALLLIPFWVSIYQYNICKIKQRITKSYR
ncbi:MAG: hypothetical protein J6W96_05810 [Alphaproteobacteria bacterium]|nr:hypothetical protein [Alphaproteobacteria bacterium]